MIHGLRFIERDVPVGNGISETRKILQFLVPCYEHGYGSPMQWVDVPLVEQPQGGADE